MESLILARWMGPWILVHQLLLHVPVRASLRLHVWRSNRRCDLDFSGKYHCPLDSKVYWIWLTAAWPSHATLWLHLSVQMCSWECSVPCQHSVNFPLLAISYWRDTGLGCGEGWCLSWCNRLLVGEILRIVLVECIHWRDCPGCCWTEAARATLN